MERQRKSQIYVTGLTFITAIFCAPVQAQYNYGSPSFQDTITPTATESTFSIQADGISCSTGGGTAPSFFIGGLSGNDRLNGPSVSDPYVYDVEGGSTGSSSSGRTSSNNGFLAAGIGFNIPLGNPSNKNVNCQAVLALVESNNFLKIMRSLKDLGALDESKAGAVIAEFLRVTGKRLRVDLTEALRPDLTINPEKVKSTSPASERPTNKPQ